ncbi:nefa-interacting nuclear nip30 [Fusarium beomiforme]|uniref:Nefa-interacting nuclear nip30 n=1 Tax=Fusarium beomiforme TaxID=44412 RepID=A0A9P5AJU7_9HYPO|nr:nefa-interacting nuclear nip30 [Fusarium beomiforme]
MSSRFVSAGKIGSSGEILKDAKGTESTVSQPLQNSAKSKEWEAVERQLEVERKHREEQRIRSATREGEKSLYDILQANKAAKQAEFEEQTKLRNQFRALDDDEIEFLDEVRANKRAEEERVKQETEEGLKAFRERQKGDIGQGETTDVEEQSESWEIGRKRKRTKEKEARGLRRKAGDVGQTAKQDTKPLEDSSCDMPDGKPKATAAKPPEKKRLGLVSYGSDSEEDDDDDDDTC